MPDPEKRHSRRPMRHPVFAVCPAIPILAAGSDVPNAHVPPKAKETGNEMGHRCHCASRACARRAYALATWRGVGSGRAGGPGSFGVVVLRWVNAGRRRSSEHQGDLGRWSVPPVIGGWRTGCFRVGSKPELVPESASERETDPDPKPEPEPDCRRGAAERDANKDSLVPRSSFPRPSFDPRNGQDPSACQDALSTRT